MNNRLIDLLARAAAGDAAAREQFHAVVRPGLVQWAQSPELAAGETALVVDAVLGRILRTLDASNPKKVKKTSAELFRDDPGLDAALKKIANELKGDFPNRRLVIKTAQGDVGAFNALFDALAAPVKLFAKRRVFDPLLADDVLVETMLFVWKNSHSFKGEAKVSTWVYGVANNKAMETVRAAGGSFVEITEGEDDDQPSEADKAVAKQQDSQEAETPVVDHMDAMKVAHCLTLLGDPESACLQLWLVGEKYEDIAEAMKQPVHWVSRKIKKGMKQIADCVHAKRPPAK